jgi:hypothetical protein
MSDEYRKAWRAYSEQNERLAVELLHREHGYGAARDRVVIVSQEDERCLARHRELVAAWPAVPTTEWLFEAARIIADVADLMERLRTERRKG